MLNILLVHFMLGCSTDANNVIRVKVYEWILYKEAVEPNKET